MPSNRGLLASDDFVATFDDLLTRFHLTAAKRSDRQLLREIHAAPFADLVRCNDPRLMAGPASCGVFDIEHTHESLRACAKQLLTVTDTQANGRQRDISAWAAHVCAWAAATCQLSLEAQAWLLVDACLRQTHNGRPGEARWISALIARFALAGQPKQTLHQVGQTIGLTRERVRQIEAVVAPALRSRPLWLPALEAARRLADGPVRLVGAYLDELVDREITASRIDIGGLSECARSVSFPWVPTHSHGLLGLTDEEYEQVARTLRGAYTNPGIGSVDEAAAVMNAGAQTPPVTAELVRLVCGTLPNLRWVDREHRWYIGADVNPRRVRLRNVARHMLSVHSPLPISSIVAGLHRLNAFRGNSVRVTSGQACAFFQSHPEFAVNGEFVQCRHDLDYRIELGVETVKMVDTLRSMPEQVECRRSIIEESVRAGVKPSTASMWLTVSEVFVKYGDSVWGLVGSHPSPARIAAIHAIVGSQSETGHALSRSSGPQ